MKTSFIRALSQSEGQNDREHRSPTLLILLNRPSRLDRPRILINSRSVDRGLEKNPHPTRLINYDQLVFIKEVRLSPELTIPKTRYDGFEVLIKIYIVFVEAHVKRISEWFRTRSGLGPSGVIKICYSWGWSDDPVADNLPQTVQIAFESSKKNPRLNRSNKLI